MAFFGLGTGKFDLQLTRAEASPGGKIQGTVVMTINSDVEAKGVVVEFWGERKMQMRDAQGKVRAQTVVVYKKINKLDVGRTYLTDESPWTYAFSFDVPPDVDKYETSSIGVGPDGEIIITPAGVVVVSGGPVMWFVKVKLDVPFSFELSKKQQVKIVMKPGGAPGPFQ